MDPEIIDFLVNLVFGYIEVPLRYFDTLGIIPAVVVVFQGRIRCCVAINADTNKRADAATQPLVEVWRKGLKGGELN